ncbi:MAG TPA: hypothetical protein VHN14_26680 [Kofleriaceae bacterium]|jgi:hypothetical protein|nr:hypothetical protein [Kofleriaceae bacterium]
MNTTFGVGNVLATGFRIWLKNFLPFMLITGLIYAPVLIWGISSVQGEITAERLRSVGRTLQSISSLTILLNILVSAALTYGVVMELQGQRASIGDSIATGLVRFFPALGTGLLSLLCICGGLLLLVIPGIIVFCMLYVATQASVIERPGVLGALKRSRELTRGHRLEIFGLVFLLTLLSFGLGKLCEVIALPHLGSPGFIDEILRNVPTYMYLTLAEQMFVGSLTAVMASVAYYFLRAEKEGTTAAELAAVFG